MWMLVGISVALASGVEIVMSGPDTVLVKAASGVVHVPSCRGVSWFLFNADTGKFEATAASACGPLAPAIRLDEDGREFLVDVPLPVLPFVGFHVLRPTVVYGEKCTDKVPFPLAKCARLASADGPQFIVRNQGSAAVKDPASVQ